MEAYFVEWLNILGRWVHFITGVAWIGSSFYFIWLDNSLEAPKEPADDEKGVGGELWSVHGGGFYHAQKYRVAPPVLPETLHWFKWEAYTTWITGMFNLRHPPPHRHAMGPRLGAARILLRAGGRCATAPRRVAGGPGGVRGAPGPSH